MYKEIEASGKTLDEALDRVSILAGRSLDELQIEIINMPSRGLFFGIGQKDARVRASFEVPDEPEVTSTFGKKKTRKEKAAAKAAKKVEPIEIQPIVAIDPEQGISNEQRQEIRRQTVQEQQNSAAKREAAKEREPRQSRPERERQSESRGADQERPGRKERAPRNNQERPSRAERPNRPERPVRTERTERTERSERPAAEPRRRESNFTPIEDTALAEQISQKAMVFLNPIFNRLGLEPAMEVGMRDGILMMSFTGEKLGLLIGRRGETLYALQYLTNLVVNKDIPEHYRIVLDVSGYRNDREQTLAAMAKKMADKAVRTGRRVELEPMNPHERRLVHLALQGDHRVDTSSHGEDPYRRVVITSKRRRNRNRPPRADQQPETADIPVVSFDSQATQPVEKDAIYDLLSQE